MSKAEKIFAGAVRLVFLVAFGAFLLASLRHIAVFFQSYEPAGTDGAGSYALAWSIDGTALVLTVGVMFFSKKMSWPSKIFIWFFIVALTGFSWLVNWEYAATFQGTLLTSHLPAAFADINPVLASSFAFLNMAYSIVAEVFSSREPTIAELQAELANLTGEGAKLREQIAKAKGPGLIDVVKEKAIKAQEAMQEIASAGRKDTPEIGLVSAQEPEQKPAQTFANFDVETGPVLRAETGAKTAPTFAPEPDENLITYWPVFGQDLTQNLAPEKAEVLAETGPATDPEMQAARQDSGELYSVELPEDPNEDGPPTTQFEALVGLRGRSSLAPYTPGPDLPENSQNSAPTAAPAPARQVTGLTYRDAAKLPICQKKGVKAGDLRAAVNAKKLTTYRDGSVSKTGVESWAKTLVASKS